MESHPPSVSRLVVRYRSAVIAALVFLGLASAVGAQQGAALPGGAFRPLPIPPLLRLSPAESDGRLAGRLVAAETTHEFLPGRPSASLGYNGSYLGPTIVVERGGSYALTIENELTELTTVHWHGLDIQADADGGPRQPIEPNAAWTAQFDIRQPAATAWYHPHAIGTTASQVAMGLAGMIIVRDTTTAAARELEASLPHTYGVDDLPVIFQDRRLNEDGESGYLPLMSDIMHGFAGNTLVTNGAVDPVATVPAGLIRLRLLNGSNAAYVRVDFPPEIDAHVIASDGGYLPSPLPVQSLLIAAAERYEVVVDMGAVADGDVFWLEAQTDSRLRGRVVGLRADRRRDPAAAVVRGPLPASLVAAPLLVEPGADLSDVPRRRFILETRGMMSRIPFTINGRAMDINRIDEQVPRGRLEIWEIFNAGPMNITHSFHVHSTSFQVVNWAGEPPPPLIAGRKDTVIVPAGATVEIAVCFDEHTGVFMYHCHMLEHEEAGLMGQFEVVE